MDTLVKLLLKLTLAGAIYVFIIRIVSGWIAPNRLSNRLLGRSISIVISVAAGYKYLLILEEFIEFSGLFRLLLFLVFLIINMVIAFAIFSTANKEPERRVIYNAGPKPYTTTRTPTAMPPTGTRTGPTTPTARPGGQPVRR